MLPPSIAGLQKTTNHRVVLPFYIYAALGFLLGTILLLSGTGAVGYHYFHPQTLAITHTMALAWGSMMIFGASHQLLPVLVEGELASDRLAYLTFGFSAVGIPFLIYGFYVLDFGWPLILGAVLINIGMICYLANVLISSFAKGQRSVHAWYVITATLWLLATTIFGLLLALNFQTPIFSANSLVYLSIHAHMGIVGWFVLMVIGVGSRLIPMFLISKYTDDRMLWWVFALLHLALIGYIVLFLAQVPQSLFYLPIALGLVAILLFARHCLKAHRVRIRKNVDKQMKTSLISVAQMLLPFVALIVALALLPQGIHPGMALIYGFCIFFGWITAIILGMTFKTMPFIVWNKVYRDKAHKGRTPAPKELFREGIYSLMLYSYLVGFAIFILGMVLIDQLVLKIGAAALLFSALMYVYNVLVIAGHKSKQA